MAHGMVISKDGDFRIMGQVYTGYDEEVNLGDDAGQEPENGAEDAAENPEAEKPMSALDQLRATSLEESLAADLNDADASTDGQFDVLTPVVRGWLLAVAKPEAYKNPCR